MLKPRESRELKITFLSKESLRCPVCEETFHREELLSGGGRLIAGPLTDELHRLYEPSSKYGIVYPLVYQVTVCPACWFAAYEGDFTSIPEKQWELVVDDREKRIADVQSIFPTVDFTASRTLAEGAASLYLALRCYEFFPKEFSPTFKQGMTALRAAWLFEELHKTIPNEHYDWLSTLFKRKARFLYRESVFKEQNGKEPLSGVRNYGPDVDKNYGYEGVLYITALLELKYGQRENVEDRAVALRESKRTIAKIFGLGKSSKAKPGPLLEKAREVYDSMSREINETDD